MASALDRNGQLTLMCGAGAGDAAGQDLSPLGHIAAKSCDILIVDMLYLVFTEDADFLFSAVVSFCHISNSLTEKPRHVETDGAEGIKS